MPKGHKAGQRLQKGKRKKKKKKLITKERITRGESKSPRLVKKGTTKRSKQVIGAFHVLFHKKNPDRKSTRLNSSHRP